MNRLLICSVLSLAVAGLASQAEAAGCANGVYRAGCAGPNGAAVVRKPATTAPHTGTVNCAAGVYHAGCAGPNGAVVTRPPATAAPRCYWSGGVRVCR